MMDAEGGVPAAAGKAEGAADVPESVVPELSAEAASGRKSGDAGAGAVGWGLDVPEDGRVEEPVEPWEERHFVDTDAGGDGSEAAGDGDAGLPAGEEEVPAPEAVEAPPGDGPGPPAEPVAAAEGVEAAPADETAVPEAVAAARAVEGAAEVGPGEGAGTAAGPAVAGREADGSGARDGGAGESAGGVREGGREPAPEREEAAAVAGAGDERSEVRPDAAAGEPQVLELLTAVKVTVEGVADAVLDLGVGSGSVREQLAEIKGGLEEAAASGGKDRGADWESVAQKVGKVREDIDVLRGLVEGHGELLKQGGKAEGESGEENFKSQLTAMLTKSLDRVDERIEGLVEQGNKQSEAFEGVKLDVKVVKEVGASVGSLGETLQAYKKDLSRDRELLGGPRKWAVLGMVVVVAPALLVAGAFVEGQWEVLPLQESTGGWKDHVWERYGLDLVECVKTGVRQGAPYDCTVDVGASVEQVRRASGR